MFCQIGAAGASDPVLAALDQALRASPLLKVRLSSACALSTREAAHILADKIGVETLGGMGRTLIAYRPPPDEVGLESVSINLAVS